MWVMQLDGQINGKKGSRKTILLQTGKGNEHLLRVFDTKAIFDRKFAANTGLTFYTPEEYFLKEAPAQYSWGSFSPQDYLHPCTS